MSLRMALLGLLAERPASGYDLTQRFAEGVGSFAWSAKHSQIYPELARLTDDRLITVVAEGARGRKEYAVTAAGRDALRDWLLAWSDGNGSVRNEFLLRLFLLAALDPADRIVALRSVADFAADQIHQLERARAEIADAGLPTGSHGDLAAMYGIYSYRATQEWVAWATDLAHAEAATQAE